MRVGSERPCRFGTDLLVAVGLVAVPLGLLGIWMLIWGGSRADGRVGVVAATDGAPMLVSTSCDPIGQATVVAVGEADSVWTTRYVGGRGRFELPMRAGVEVDGYVPTGGVYDPSTQYDLLSVSNLAGRGIGNAWIQFRLSDLRSDAVIVGLNRVGGSPVYEPLEEFVAERERCR